MDKKIYINKEDTKFHKLINNEVFWLRFSWFCVTGLLDTMRVYRSRNKLPSKRIMTEFVIEYKLMENDPRNEMDIYLDLLSCD